MCTIADAKVRQNYNCYNVYFNECLRLFKINTFYRNVSRKYKHTYSEELMHKNADEAIDAMYQIELTLLRRKPTIERWKDCYMANNDKWYFAYKINGDVITVVDACHAQNMK